MYYIAKCVFIICANNGMNEMENKNRKTTI